ncbi:MAG TPA: chemotaxis response regulator protein-glutamate methylesterase [Thermoanaerobaculia bacterium]
MTNVIRVLVVDDSAFVRKVVSQMLARSPFIEVVGTARDGSEALEMVERVKPDVITLDLMMSPMNGVEFLRRQMARRPIPVVTCSIAHESGALALDAFDAGAVEFVQKPTALATDRLLDIGEELVSKVKTAAAVQMKNLESVIRGRNGAPRRAGLDGGMAAVASQPPEGQAATRRAEIVVIGVSTGGPQALRYLIPALPADFPVPVAIALHMPEGYTEMFAKRLDELSALHVKEAEEGDILRQGTVLLAPAGRHLTFRRDASGIVRSHLDVRPIDTQHRPSVDVLFRAAADVYEDAVVGVVMTGMGSDGLLGAAHIKGCGGRIVTEAESSCVVYGMPRAVDEALISDASVPLEDLPATIHRLI